MHRQGRAVSLAVLIAGLSGLMPGGPARADSYTDLAARISAQISAQVAAPQDPGTVAPDTVPDTVIDFQALRIAYAASAAYDPDGGKIRERRRRMMAAAQAGDCPQVLRIAADIHRDYITHLSSYRLALICAQRLGDAAQERINARMFQGLVDAIAATGDGRSPATALAVVAIEEEYGVLAARGLRRERQALIHEDGHSYDKMDAVDDRGGHTTVYFNVDLPLSREAMDVMGPPPAGQD